MALYGPARPKTCRREPECCQAVSSAISSKAADESPVTRVTRFPETTGGAARIAYGRLRAAGIPAQALLASAGLTRRQLSDPGSRFHSRAQMDFLGLAAESLSDDLLGFHMAQEIELREVGLLYFVLASSETLRDVLSRGARYTRLVNEGLVPELVEGAEVGYRLRYSGMSRPRDRQQAEFWLTSILRIVRQLTGKRVLPVRVHVVHTRGRGAGELRRFFGCAIEYGAPVDLILFPREYAKMPVVNAEPYLNKLLVGFSEKAIAHRLAGRGPVRARVENAAAPLLPHGRVSVDDIAKRLGVGRRTLARQLAAEGSSFSEVMKELRHDLARRHLADGQSSISRIAWLVGFRDVGTFSHAFKRWNGCSPREFQRQQRQR